MNSWKFSLILLFAILLPSFFYLGFKGSWAAWPTGINLIIVVSLMIDCLICESDEKDGEL